MHKQHPKDLYVLSHTKQISEKGTKAISGFKGSLITLHSCSKGEGVDLSKIQEGEWLISQSGHPNTVPPSTITLTSWIPTTVSCFEKIGVKYCRFCFLLSKFGRTDPFCLSKAHPISSFHVYIYIPWLYQTRGSPFPEFFFTKDAPDTWIQVSIHPSTLPLP